MARAHYQEAKDVICDTLEITPEELGDQTLFVDELGIDSILIAELKTRFEEKYGIKIDREDIPQLDSLNNVVDYLSRNLPS